MVEETGPQSEFEEISQWFWDIIEQTDSNRDVLIILLNRQTKEQVHLFAREFERAILQLKEVPWIERMTLDGYISEDNVDDVAGWIVSQGKVYYMRVLADPTKTPLADDIDDSQNLSGVAYSVFSQRFGEDLYIDI